MAVYKKKTMRLNEMLDEKLVLEGELLRYKASGLQLSQPVTSSRCRIERKQ